MREPACGVRTLVFGFALSNSRSRHVILDNLAQSVSHVVWMWRSVGVGRRRVLIGPHTP